MVALQQMELIFMCDIPCIFVYDCSNFTNTCTIHLFIMYIIKRWIVHVLVKLLQS
jgi:hypothetical protein